MRCTACRSFGPHTAEQCSARRRRCHINGCQRKTCIQARVHGYPPTCLVHFFGDEPGFVPSKVRRGRLTTWAAYPSLTESDGGFFPINLPDGSANLEGLNALLRAKG